MREVWLVDLLRDQVEVHRDRRPERVQHIEIRGRGTRLEPAAFRGLSLAVDLLLG